MKDGMHGVHFVEGAILYELAIFKRLETIERYQDKNNPVYVKNFVSKLMNVVK